MHRALVVIPCGAAKVWHKNPTAGPVCAGLAYTGTPLKINRSYAQTFGDRWLILSAKFGLLDPDTPITDYNVTFNKRSKYVVTIPAICQKI
jgi:hypothetical protein